MKVDVKTKIAGREYPITIPAEDETYLREAAEKLNTQIEVIQSVLRVESVQDILATLLLLTYAQQLKNGNKDKTENS